MRNGRSTSRSRAGCADGRAEQSQHRPKPWWLHGRPLLATAALAEVVAVACSAWSRLRSLLIHAAEAVVVQQTAAMGSSRKGRSRGGWADGRYGQQQRPKSWWLHGWPLWAIVAEAEAVAVAQTAVMSSRVTGRGRGGCADGRDGQ